MTSTPQNSTGQVELNSLIAQWNHLKEQSNLLFPAQERLFIPSHWMASQHHSSFDAGSGSPVSSPKKPFPLRIARSIWLVFKMLPIIGPALFKVKQRVFGPKLSDTETKLLISAVMSLDQRLHNLEQSLANATLHAPRHHS